VERDDIPKIDEILERFSDDFAIDFGGGGFGGSGVTRSFDDSLTPTGQKKNPVVYVIMEA